MERERLNLQALEPLLQEPSIAEQNRAAVVERTLPNWWRQNVDTARCACTFMDSRRGWGTACTDACVSVSV